MALFGPEDTANGRQYARRSSSFTRPADTNAYNAGDIVANDVDAADVDPLSWATAGTRPFRIKGVRLRKSAASITNAQFRVHIYAAAPTVATTGDNGSYANVAGGDEWLGSFDGTMVATHSDGAVVNCLPTGNSPRLDYIGDPGTLYGLIEALAAYTPASEEVFTTTIQFEFLP